MNQITSKPGEIEGVKSNDHALSIVEMKIDQEDGNRLAIQTAIEKNSALITETAIWITTVCDFHNMGIAALSTSIWWKVPGLIEGLDYKSLFYIGHTTSAATCCGLIEIVIEPPWHGTLSQTNAALSEGVFE